MKSYVMFAQAADIFFSLLEPPSVIVSYVFKCLIYAKMLFYFTDVYTSFCHLKFFTWK